MSRRALRQIDPQLDLSRHLLAWEQLDRPFRYQQLFEQPGPLEVEVGSGKGLFLATASGRRPDRNFLGCEVSGKFARFAAAKLARQQRRNAAIVHGDAQRLFTEWLPTGSAAAVHIYFPDPWWKKRHLRRRIMNEPFLRQVERVLEPGGTLHFWTDVPEYYHTAVETIARCTGLEGPIAVLELPAADELDFRTHFERRMRLHGVPVQRAEFRRR